MYHLFTILNHVESCIVCFHTLLTGAVQGQECSRQRGKPLIYIVAPFLSLT